MEKNRFILFLIGLLATAFFTHLEGANSAGFALVRDSTGRVIVVGQTNNIDNGTLDIALARYNPDGSLDATFNSSGVQPGTIIFGTSTRDETANAVTIDQNGKIVVVGCLQVV